LLTIHEPFSLEGLEGFEIAIDEGFTEGRFRRRVNRFLVEVEVELGTVSAHLPNSGRLEKSLAPDCSVFLLRRRPSKRRTRYDLFASEPESGVKVILDSRFANEVVYQALKRRMRGSEAKIQREAYVKGVRIDFLCRGSTGELYLEAKSVTYVEEGAALFPDAPTKRGLSQLTTFAQLLGEGKKVAVAFVVQRPDASTISVNWAVDPRFSRRLTGLIGAGLRIYTLTAMLKDESLVRVVIGRPVFLVV